MKNTQAQHLGVPGQVEEVEVARPGREEEAPSLKEGSFQEPGKEPGQGDGRLLGRGGATLCSFL